ncbi:MAG: hypothetical protein V1784_06625, partial [bacterium]
AKPKITGDAASTKIAASRSPATLGRNEAGAKETGLGRGMEAVEKAAKSGKYEFVLFYREDNDSMRMAANAVESAKRRSPRKADWVAVNVTDPAEKDIVQRFRADRAPMPLVLAVAPNGAVTGSAVGAIDENKLVDAVVSKGAEQTLGALQQRKAVLLAVQGRKTSENRAAMKGLQDFKADPKYGPATEIVTVDPSDPDESKFLSQLQIDPNTNVATTVFLLPPGSPIATYRGATQKQQLVASLQAAQSKSGGCCPPGSGKTCGPTPTKSK